MKKIILSTLLALGLAASAQAGELQKDYFANTGPGAWATYQLKISDGTQAASSSQREADQGGQVVVEETIRSRPARAPAPWSKPSTSCPRVSTWPATG